jgi:hypothetical protein
VPLPAATVGRRLAAKIIDAILVFGPVAALACAAFYLLPDPTAYFAPTLAFGCGLIAFSVYTVTDGSITAGGRSESG